MLCRHVEHLEAHGVHFPRWPGFGAVAAGGVGSGNGGAIAALIARENRSKHYKRDDGVAEIQKLREFTAPTVLYSSEVMALFEEERLAFAVELARSAGFVTKAAYYLREETSYLNSAFARASATREMKVSQGTFVETHAPPFARHLRSLRKVLGEEHVIVRDYDWAKADLFGDFCVNVLRIPRPSGDMPWTNSSAEQVPFSAPR